MDMNFLGDAFFLGPVVSVDDGFVPVNCKVRTIFRSSWSERRHDSNSPGIALVGDDGRVGLTGVLILAATLPTVVSVPVV